jgi:hypothetical protein
MKRIKLEFLMTAIAVAVLAGSLFFTAQADARRGGVGGAGRGFGAGGFSGGSFRGGGGYATGPRGGAAVSGPRGGAAVSGPRGGAAVSGPRGGAAVRGPGGYGAARGPAGNVAARGPGGSYAGGTYNRNVTVNQGWGAWGGYRPGAVAAGVAAGVAVGSAVAALPPSYSTVVVNNQPYYFANGAYYQQCYQGAEVGYCVVANPNP